MNKRDIHLEIEGRAKELRIWAARLDPASPALAALFRAEVESIEAKGSSAYDSFGVTLLMGKVNGLTAAAHVLLEEWAKHH